MLFSQLRRRNGEGTVKPEELFADYRPFRLEEEREREDEHRALMSSIIDWAISILGETSLRAIYSSIFFEHLIVFDFRSPFLFLGLAFCIAGCKGCSAYSQRITEDLEL